MAAGCGEKRLRKVNLQHEQEGIGGVRHTTGDKLQHLLHISLPVFGKVPQGLVQD